MIRTKNTFDITAIVKTYMFGPEGQQIDRSHTETEPRKLFFPTYLLSSIESTRYFIKQNMDWTSSNVANVSNVISAILNIGFDNIFHDTVIQSHISSLIAFRERIYKRNDDVPLYVQSLLESLARMDILQLPNDTLSGSSCIQPRIPRHVLGMLGDKAHDLGTRHGRIVDIITIMLIKVLVDQPCVRDDHRHTMEQCLTEVESFLHQRVMFVKAQLQTVERMSKEWKS